ncbi:MAG: dimethylsulfonioproprionate lyase family protein [Gammaproteobacteria bacterium]|nr:dimethylsulfonioproprionate lyase family protein [Gammaproteobacteria bacterium]
MGDSSAFDHAAMQAVTAVREIFEAEAANNPACSEQLGRVLALMQELRPDSKRAAPRQFPGCRHLVRTLELAESGPTAAVAAAIRRLQPDLAWAQNPRYNAANMGAEFMDNYAWSGLGLTGSHKMALGVLLLGPGVTYPPTSYESEGVFLVIGGSPEWKSGDVPWVRIEPGAIICRPYGGSEGKRPGDEPMLALYAWMYR